VSIKKNKKQYAGLVFRQQIYTIILNNPENYKINDKIICLNGPSDGLVYSILGPFQDR
jgi:hypothetical protein